RSEVWYFAGPAIGALRQDNFKYYFIQQGEGIDGLAGPIIKPQALWIVNLKLDPFERTLIQNLNLTPTAMNDFYMHQFWRITYVQQIMAPFAQSFVDFPPQQAPASFNIDAIVSQVKEQIAAHAGS